MGGKKVSRDRWVGRRTERAGGWDEVSMSTRVGRRTKWAGGLGEGFSEQVGGAKD